MIILPDYRPALQPQEPIWIPGHIENSITIPNEITPARLVKESTRLLSARTTIPNLLVWTCSDSRIVTPPEVDKVAAIAAGGIGLHESQLTGSDVVVMTHFDSETLTADTIGGCGGLNALAQVKQGADLRRNHIVTADGPADIHVADYLDADHIAHEDPFHQAYHSARQINAITQRSVLLTVQDHRTGLIAVFGWLDQKGDLHASETVATRLLQEGEPFTLADIYGSQLSLNEQLELPEVFQQFLTITQDQRRINSRSLKLRAEAQFDLSQQQNPSTILASTNLAPITARSQSLALTGRCFQVTAPSELHSSDRLRDTIAQIHYAIAHFSNCSKLILDLNSIEDAQHVAEVIAQQSWGKSWLSQENHKIIVSTHDAAGVFDPQTTQYYTPLAIA